MRLWAWLALGMLASLLTLQATTRLGARDVHRWLVPNEGLRLQKIGMAWQIIALLAACATTLGAQPMIATALDSTEINADLPTAWVAVAIMLCGAFAGLLVALSRIDLACQLLPDSLTLLLIATGLAFHAMTQAIHIADAMIGAAAGYGVLWFLAWCFKQIRDIEAMGRGDFAMTAGLGAWLGWQPLPLMLTIASLGALLAIGLSQIFAAPNRGSREPGHWAHMLKSESAFGPALAFGGLITWVQLG